MPKALADCVCNTAQPLFYCESRLQADMERRFAGLLKGGGQAALARQLQEQVAEELSVLFEGLRRDMRQYKRGQAARGSQPAGGGAGTAGAAARAAAAVVPYGRQLAEGGIKMGCSNLTVLVRGRCPVAERVDTAGWRVLKVQSSLAMWQIVCQPCATHAACRMSVAPVPSSRLSLQPADQRRCLPAGVQFQREFWIKAGLGQPLCYPSLDCEVNFPA